MKKLNQKGVSLAELLAVVVIMGIIAAIAIPLVGNVIETSKKKAYLGDLTTVVEAARTYCIAEGNSGEGICSAGGATLQGSGSVLEKYISKPIGDINDFVQVKYEENKYKVYGDNDADDTGFTTSGKWIDVTSDSSLDLISKKSDKAAYNNADNKTAAGTYLLAFINLLGDTAITNSGEDYNESGNILPSQKVGGAIQANIITSKGTMTLSSDKFSSSESPNINTYNDTTSGKEKYISLLTGIESSSNTKEFYKFSVTVNGQTYTSGNDFVYKNNIQTYINALSR